MRCCCPELSEIPSEALVLNQTAFFVDSVNGNDSFPGTAAFPIRTLQELQLRFQSRRLLANTVVTLIGTFAEVLTLNCVIPDDITLTITAPVTTVFSGTIGAFTPYAAGVTAALLQDPTLVAVTQVARRFRMTSGPAAGFLAWGLLDTAIDTIRISAFHNGVFTVTNPVAGDTYVVETFDTTILGLAIDTIGNGGITLTNLSVSNVGVSTNFFNTHSAFAVAYGCQFTGGCNWRSSQMSLRATRHAGSIQGFTDNSNVIASAIACFGNLSTTSGGLISFVHRADFQAAKITFTGAPSILANPNAHMAFYNLPATGIDAAVTLDALGSLIQTTAGALIWGIAPLQAFGVRVLSGCSLQYLTKPTVTGITADTVIGGTNTTWGAIPFINPANNAMIVLRA
jgi:hypothetical protein